MLLDLIGYAATTLTAAIAIPQAVRSVRHGTAGISPATFQLFGMLGVMWGAYAWSQQYWPIVPGNVCQIAASAVILYQCHRHGTSIFNVSAIAAALLVVTIATTIAFGPKTMILVAIGIGVLTRVPQIIEVVRSEKIDGISVSTWVLATACNFLWLAYAIGHSDPRIVVSSILNGGTSLLIVGIVWRRKASTKELTSVAPEIAG